MGIILVSKSFYQYEYSLFNNLFISFFEVDVSFTSVINKAKNQVELKMTVNEPFSIPTNTE